MASWQKIESRFENQPRRVLSSLSLESRPLASAESRSSQAVEFHDGGFVEGLQATLLILKIDQSFVHRITANLDESPIVNAIIDMGKNLKQRVIAEGIETQEQLTFFRPITVQKDKATSSAGPWPPHNLPIYFRWA
jgi:hypothetical protein